MNTNFRNAIGEKPVLQLMGEQIASYFVRQTDMTFHLIEGRAWITYDDNDLIVERGETIHLPKSRHRIIVSAANPKQTISYQLS